MMQCSIESQCSSLRIGCIITIYICFRPSIADQQKVGFFSQDRATQTAESEIVNLKEMTDVIQTLLKVGILRFIN